MSYVEPPLTTPGQFVTEVDYNRLVTNIINHNSRLGVLEQPPAGNPANINIGGIILYWGLLSNLPAGWALCDGANGTPDLRDRFVIGAGGTRAPGITGGATAHIHSNPNTNSAGGHNHTASGGSGSQTGALAFLTDATGLSVNSTHTHSWSATSSSVGTHDHSKPSTGSSGQLPSNLALFFIMRIS